VPYLNALFLISLQIAANWLRIGCGLRQNTRIFHFIKVNNNNMLALSQSSVTPEGVGSSPIGPRQKI